MAPIDFYAPKNFRAYEFLSPAVWDKFGDRGLYLCIDVRLVITADQIRDFFGAPMTINNWYWKRADNKPFEEWTTGRGYREDSWYTDLGLNPSDSLSQHRFGRAIDFEIKGVSATEVRDVILNHQSAFPFLRRIEGGVPWVHVDVANTFHHGIHLFDPN